MLPIRQRYREAGEVHGFGQVTGAGDAGRFEQTRRRVHGKGEHDGVGLHDHAPGHGEPPSSPGLRNPRDAEGRLDPSLHLRRQRLHQLAHPTRETREPGLHVFQPRLDAEQRRGPALFEPFERGAVPQV